MNTPVLSNQFLSKIPINHSQNNIYSALVTKIDFDHFYIKNPFTSLDDICDTALSCMLLPKVGDNVLVLNCSNQNFIISILTTSSPFHTINLPNEIHASIKASQLEISADKFTLKSNNLSINTVKALFRSDSTKFVSKFVSSFLNTSISKIKTYGSLINERIVKVTNSDSLMARQIHFKASDLFRTKSQLIQLQSKSYVLIDGKKIFLG